MGVQSHLLKCSGLPPLCSLLDGIEGHLAWQWVRVKAWTWLGWAGALIVTSGLVTTLGRCISFQF